MKILLAVDGSSHSTAAIDEVARRPWPDGSEVRVLSVIQPYTPPATEYVLAGATLEDIERQQMITAEQMTSHAAEVVTSDKVATETAVRKGDPASAIVEEATEWEADLVVVGSHGRTGLKRWLLGSVAQRVVGHAPCSVEVVRRRRTAGNTSSGIAMIA